MNCPLRPAVCRVFDFAPTLAYEGAAEGGGDIDLNTKQLTACQTCSRYGITSSTFQPLGSKRRRVKRIDQAIPCLFVVFGACDAKVM